MVEQGLVQALVQALVQELELALGLGLDLAVDHQQQRHLPHPSGLSFHLGCLDPAAHDL